MALGRWLAQLFGAGRNPVVETIEVFQENREGAALRAAQLRAQAMSQYAAEFHARSNRTYVDVFADALNRLVRPTITIALFYPIPATVYAPEQMARVWGAMATLPAGYWAVVGLVLPFYFGGRMQMKALDARFWASSANALGTTLPSEGQTDGENPALDEWLRSRGGE